MKSLISPRTWEKNINNEFLNLLLLWFFLVTALICFVCIMTKKNIYIQPITHPQKKITKQKNQERFNQAKFCCFFGSTEKNGTAEKKRERERTKWALQLKWRWPYGLCVNERTHSVGLSMFELSVLQFNSFKVINDLAFFCCYKTRFAAIIMTRILILCIFLLRYSFSSVDNLMSWVRGFAYIVGTEFISTGLPYALSNLLNLQIVTFWILWPFSLVWLQRDSCTQNTKMS